MTTVSLLAERVLQSSNPQNKVVAAHALSKAWKDGVDIGEPISPKDYPARPERPVCVSPSDVPRRRLGSEHGRAALMHAVAHIEFNAIDLAADMVARFIHNPLLPHEDRKAFASDWISVCDDEARHFGLITDRLSEMDVTYGDLPAHNGLWDAALATKDNFAARLAIAPMVLEARGLDVTPAMIEKLKSAGDSKSAAILEIIYTEEVGHVAIGRRWFSVITRNSTIDDALHFQTLVKKYFKGPLKPPFNVVARDKAQLPREFYMPLAPNT
ncbi:ferritin-like domain-containing protein [Fretibacter rubidus]|uniref:ferritin-like domain-containing protein n=1 Tax=Fretibacter rubidus TaxID=570162 RepID=UPI00352B7F20